MEPTRIELLQQTSLFGGIREDIVALVLARAPLVQRARDAFFFREGDPAEAMYVLESGRVAVVKGASRRPYVIRELDAGACFGEISLLDFSPRSASVLALCDCSAIEISAASLHAIYERDVEQFAILEMNMGREVARRLREADAALDAIQGSSGA